MAKLGGIGEEGSGDFFLTFSTGNQYSYGTEALNALTMFPPEQLDVLFEGAIEAVEEAILNSLCMAETIEGQKQRKVYEIPLEKVRDIIK